MKNYDLVKNRRPLLFSLIIIIACLGFTSTMLSKKDHSTLETSDLEEKIDKLVDRYDENHDFNGAILVAKDGKVVFSKGVGTANMEWDVANQADTKFRIGSITKQFTAMAILKLVAEKKLDLNTPISAYLPDYPKANADRITIHQLLTHSSGTPNNYDAPFEKERRPDSQDPEKLVNEFSALPLEFTPGEKFDYSNAGYNTLGLIIEKITGKRYEEVLKEKIFEPLNMQNTGFDKHRMLIKNRADGYFNSYGIFYNSNYVNMSKVFAAGAIYSTVEDLFKWDQALYTEQLIPKEYLTMTFNKHIKDVDYGGYYGYGWSIKDKAIGESQDSVETISHDGVIDGFCAIFTRIPETKSTIILLSNVRRAPLNAMTKGIMGILYDKPYDFPRRSLAYSLMDKINEEGIDKGVAFFEAANNDVTYFLIESEVNIVSYMLLQTERAEEAAKVLELGITVFPEAFNLYDSYGEILRKLGRTDESIKNYKKSIELNPENENGIRMLKEMGVI